MYLVNNLAAWLTDETPKPHMSRMPRHNEDPFKMPTHINPACIVLALFVIIGILLYMRARRNPNNPDW